MIGARIRQARQRAGMTLDQLSAALREAGHPLTKAALSKYERDEYQVPAPLLPKLGRILGVGPEHFLQERPERTVSFGRYRRKSRMSVRKQKQVQAGVEEQISRYLEILALSPEAVIAPGIRREAARVSTPDGAEKIAEGLRTEWGLGSEPLESVCQLLEDKGILVFQHDRPEEDFDGLSGWVEDEPALPFVVIEPAKSVDRRRLNLAHELAHLVLDPQGDLTNRDHERLAFRFGAALLVPREAALRELGARRQVLDLRELAALKLKWGLSMSAWIRRAWDLGIIRQSQYVAWCRLFSARGWREQEPVEYRSEIEEPLRLRLLTLRALAERRIGPAQAETLCPGILEDSSPAGLGGRSLRSLLEESRIAESDEEPDEDFY